MLHCFVKNYLGYFLWQYPAFEVGLGYKPQKYGNTVRLLFLKIVCISAGTNSYSVPWTREATLWQNAD